MINLLNRFTQQFKSLVERQWYSKNPGFLGLFLPLEYVFRYLSSLRRRRLISKAYLPSIPTVVVGNISVGGTGKTPFIIELVKYLQSQGLRPGVVSRGYGRESRHLHRVSTSSSALDAGDEPLLIFQQTHCAVVVHEERVKAVKALMDIHDIDIILADDGLQHYRLGRHMELALVDSQAKFGNGHCLPVGPLREALGRLSSIDCAIIMGLAEGGEQIVKDLALVRVPEVFCAYVEALQWKSLDGKVTHPLGFFSNKEAWALAGIGKPEKFYITLRQLNVNFSAKSFADHYAYVGRDFNFLRDDDFQKPCLMTSKDAIKCHELNLKNTWYLDIRVVISDEFKQYFMTKIRSIEKPIS